MRMLLAVALGLALGLALAAQAPGQGAGKGKGKKGLRPGEINTPAARGERLPDRLNVGDCAPDFTLPDVDGKKKVTLADFRGDRPVVLIFGSFT